METNKVKLGDYLYIKGRIGWKGLKKEEYLPLGEYRIINGESLTPNGIDWDSAGYISEERYLESPEIMLQNDDILLSKDGTIGKIGYVKDLEMPTSVASGIFVIRNQKPEIINTRFIYYYLLSNNFKNFIKMRTEGSVIPHLYQKDFVSLDFPLHDIETQNKIVSVLNSVDEKIETNKEINNNLEKQADLIFKNEFLSERKERKQWVKSSLADIANYTNGLAMQKKRPEEGEESLPVLKIKELKQGYCDSESDRCSANIPTNYVVNDGDVIFSWSATLLVDFWCGGECGLNQHLFKVTSNKYDKWFYYAWTKYYQKQFAAIAADRATTMGHIKRENLDKAEVLIPPTEEYKRIGEVLQPIYNKIIYNRIENRNLEQVRDRLISYYMSDNCNID